MVQQIISVVAIALVLAAVVDRILYALLGVNNRQK